LQFFKGALGIIEFGIVDTRQAGAAAFDHVAGNLNLAGEGEHIRCQAAIDQHRRVNVSAGSRGLSLFHNGRQVF
jgi:hypothetical protein